jgi:hypothetical protein
LPRATSAHPNVNLSIASNFSIPVDSIAIWINCAIRQHARSQFLWLIYKRVYSLWECFNFMTHRNITVRTKGPVGTTAAKPVLHKMAGGIARCKADNGL